MSEHFDHYLSYDYERGPKQTLLDLAEFCEEAAKADDFGEGELHDRLEHQVTDLLGMEAGLFMPTGRIIQLIALKVWCDQSNCKSVAMHPRCHLEEYEQNAYNHVFGLRAVPLGRLQEPNCGNDLESIAEPLGAATLEVPILSLGCAAPTWASLEELSQEARARECPIHLDGSRIWEIQPHYGRSFADIAKLFDSVFVSFYKGMLGIAGGMLLGSAEFIGRAKVWQHRLGGNPPRQYPMLLSAQKGLQERLHLMPKFYAKGRELADGLSSLPRVRVNPNPPPAGMMHVMLEGRQDALLQVAAEVSREVGFWLVDVPRETGIAGLAAFQIVVGEATLDIPTNKIVAAVRLLQERLPNATSP